MGTLKWGWHMPSFPVDGSSGPIFIGHIRQTLQHIHPYIDSVWVDDHLMPWATWQPSTTPYLECATTIASFAASYPTLRFGASVFCQSYRNPGLLAKMAANLQLLTGGRFIFGIGAGWMQAEYDAYGYDFPSPGVRMTQLEETIEIVKRLWTSSPASFAGTYYQIQSAYCEPRPDPIPPILIGGGGEQRTLRIVAKYADWWNIPGGTIDIYAHKLSVLQQHCRAIGRDPATIVKTWSPDGIALAQTQAEAQRIADQSPYTNSGCLIGTPEQVAEQLQAFVDLGVEHLIVRLLDFPSTTGFDLLVQEVMPRIKA